MATDDDDILTGPVPAPDAEATPAERARAKTFADLVDKTLAGRTPPAMSADDRALLEVATVIRAASGNAELAATKRRSLVEDALRQAVGGAGATMSGSVIPIERARGRWVPWAVAATTTLVATTRCAVCSSASSDIRNGSCTASGTSRPVNPKLSARAARAGTSASFMCGLSMVA